jgi:hypothetical protein
MKKVLRNTSRQASYDRPFVGNRLLADADLVYSMENMQKFDLAGAESRS